MQSHVSVLLVTFLIRPLFVFGPLPSAANATPFRVLEAPSPGYVFPFGFNNRGEIVGEFRDQSPIPHSQPFFIDRQGVFHLLELPSAFASLGAVAYDINRRGDIVGTLTTPGFSNNVGFVRGRDGSFVTFQIAGAIDTMATAINDRGEIAGVFSTKDARYGFLRHRNGSITEFTVPGSNVQAVYGLNNQGDIVGFGGDGTFLRDRAGHFKVLEGGLCCTNDINNRGQTVGQANLKLGHVAGFVRQPDGLLLLLDAPGADVTIFYDINDRDVVVGIFSGQAGLQGFVASLDAFAPTPEPATLLLFGTTAVGLGMAWRKRRRGLPPAV
jgi:hypothetical protein